MAGGTELDEVCRHLEITESTWHRWVAQYGGMRARDAKRLKELRGQNGRLKKLVIERLPSPVDDVVRRLRSEDVFMLAAGLAFYALVSVAPFAILALWLVSLLTSDARVQEVSDLLARLAPHRLNVDEAFRRVSQLGAELGFGAFERYNEKPRSTTTTITMARRDARRRPLTNQASTPVSGLAPRRSTLGGNPSSLRHHGFAPLPTNETVVALFACSGT